MNCVWTPSTALTDAHVSEIRNLMKRDCCWILTIIGYELNLNHLTVEFLRMICVWLDTVDCWIIGTFNASHHTLCEQVFGQVKKVFCGTPALLILVHIYDFFLF